MTQVQIYINMAAALTVFIGGLFVVFVYPSHLSTPARYALGIFVTFYFILRMAQTIVQIRRHRHGAENGLRHVLEEDEDTKDGPKSP